MQINRIKCECCTSLVDVSPFKNKLWSDHSILMMRLDIAVGHSNIYGTLVVKTEVTFIYRNQPKIGRRGMSGISGECLFSRLLGRVCL